ncbi:putative AT hook motif family protein [Rosellinia necatrix]|uniref:Putative AT hook motif family protein n=1 Tax=Rosellinia necatrix TaxID=77044 RepID=A0A1W2THD3_ROSNE|nr:putative AT hook motif family protein [Rosellinia necatrix]
MPSDAIERDGFSCSYGRFYATDRRQECVPGPVLRAAFLPKLTPAGNKYIRDSYGQSFVRGQLKHYGIPFNGGQLTGNGTQFLKKALQAGMCDQVPPHITKLRDEMHAEWLAQLTPAELSGYPEWVMEKYFLTSGQADCAKTTAVVGIPLDRYSSHRSDQLRKAADKIPGLNHETGFGPTTQTIFLGWDSTAVDRAAKGHADKEVRAVKAANEERDQERSEMHGDYLKSIGKKKGRKAYSPVGTYIVDCDAIEEEWPNLADDMSLDIHATDQPGIYEACFDFGVIEGVMVIGADETAVETYCSQLDRESDDEEDTSEDSSGDEKKPASKRKYTSTTAKGRGHGRPSKKAKGSSSQSRKYYLKSRSSDKEEGMIYYEPEAGSITFQGENMASFTGEASFPCVGASVSFTARKTSDQDDGPETSWSDLSEAAYERARVGRWH